MTSNQYFKLVITIEKGMNRPFLQKFKTVGKFKVIQFGFLGLFVQFSYGLEKR